MNPIIKILILADFFVYFGLGLIQPIFAVFIKDQLQDGTLAAAGIAATVFLITKAVLQIPIARFADREPAKIREFWTLVIGYFLIAITPFIYYFITNVTQLYLTQILYGLGAALSYPGWMAIFAKFADHEHSAFSWSFYSTIVMVAMAVASAVGGFVGEAYGFRTLFLGVGALTFLGFFSTVGLTLFYKDLRLVNPPGLRSIRERIVEVVLRHKHSPIPPSASSGQMPK
ncbi:MAG: hypothetical protein UX98_C0015G0020 [Parcubacteria group bacterium GW2011_GWA2_47_26]|nr:MAG: hypothetical protein UX98_C0015G0020 [Parcubacteria group bacterium GW2011_GWA2_47_26]